MLNYCLGHLPLLILLATFAATLFAAARTLPAQNVLAAAFLIVVISTIIEMIGAKTGIPFGNFIYTENLGRLIFRALPWPVPLIWVVTILNSRGVARLLLRPWRERPHYGYWSIGLTCLLAVFSDAALEPFSRANRYWLWQNSESIPAWYGVTWMNFAAWGGATLLIQIIILPWLIDKKSDRQPAPDYPPLVLWLLFILLLTVANAVHSCWLAAGFGFCGATLVTVIAWRNSRV